MKKNFKYAFIAAIAILGLNSCVKDLNVESIDKNSVSAIDPAQLLGKIYSTLGTTGQEGPAGNGDIEGLDEGTSSFYRMTYELNEFPSDQIYWIWPDVGVDDVRKATWTASNALVRGAYCRYIFDITLCNLYITQYAEVDPIKTAEVRFLRALNYWYLLDMFGNVPFNITSAEMAAYDKKADLMGANENYPKQIKRANLYKWIESELQFCEEVLPENRISYYRVDRSAAQLLLARLYLNAEVYTGKADWKNAALYAKKVLSSGHQLASKYEYLFMGDNDNLSAVNDAWKEIILPVAQDHEMIQSYGGSRFLIASFYADGMPSSGVTDSWKCIRTRKQLISLFIPEVKNFSISDKNNDPATWFTTNTSLMAEIEKMAEPKGDMSVIREYAKDDRAMFLNYREYNDSSLIVCNIQKSNDKDEFFSGWLCTKYSNNMADPTRVIPETEDKANPDTDIPLMRLAEAYLTYAEAVVRDPSAAVEGYTAEEAINALRTRANAEPLAMLDIEEVFKEWGREFYSEARRRTDLVRFGKFTGSSYEWEWKAGNQFGKKAIDDFRTVFPIPFSDITANPNLTQNKGYE